MMARTGEVMMHRAFRANLHPQADAYPADPEAVPAVAGSIEASPRRIGKRKRPRKRRLPAPG
jgi:hypothetical protein